MSAVAGLFCFRALGDIGEVRFPPIASHFNDLISRRSRARRSDVALGTILWPHPNEGWPMLKVTCVGAALMVVATQSFAAPFQFEAQVSLDDMRTVVQKQFSVTSTRDQVRQVFVGEGGGTLVAHPRRANVEKYIYDINLCSYYVWRWNISADYGRDGKLEQLFVNGMPALHGAQAPATPEKGPFYKLSRGRPEAFKGEKSLAAIVSDEDGNLKTTDDMLILTGVGPTRADPLNLGRALNHPGVVWRSIFDFDQAKSVVPYSGDCNAVDAAMTKAAAPRAP